MSTPPPAHPGYHPGVSASSTLPRPRRILHIARRYAPLVGGMERYVLDVATDQARSGADVRVVTLRSDILGVHDGVLPADERRDGVRVIRLPGTGNQRFGLCFRPDRLAREIRQVDVVHLHDLRFMTGFVCVAARLLGRPLVYHTHGLLWHTSFASGLKQRLMRHYYGPLLRFGRANVVASSEHDRELLLADVPSLSSRTVTLPNAVDLVPYLAAERRPVPGRLLVIGRVADRKGIDRPRAGLGVRGPRAGGPGGPVGAGGPGGGGGRARLDGIIERHRLGDAVTFLGGYTDAEHLTLLEEAALAIFPSRAEGFGLALLEAMAAGVPLLASDIPPHRALLAGGLEDRLVDFDRPEAVADALAAALTSPGTSASTADRSLRAAAAPYAIRRLTDDIGELYNRVGVPPRSVSPAS